MLDFVISVLAYADDITLLSLSADNLQCLLNICESWRKSNEMTFGLDKCFILVFNSRSKKLEHLPSLYLQGPDGKPHRLVSNYPEKSKELYLGFNPTDLIARSKIDKENTQPHILVPNFRNKPNPRYLKRIIAKFHRSRHGQNLLCSDHAILTPSISVRIYKTLQRSTLLYAIEFCDWDLDQIGVLEVQQSKALRCHIDSDAQCPQSILRLVLGVEPVEARRDLHVLLYYAKLCKTPSTTLLGQMHRYRSQNLSTLPVGFYRTVYHLLVKYNLIPLWNNFPEVAHDELIRFLKK